MKRKSGSSISWLQRQARDPFVQARQEQGLVARSAFKLQQLRAVRPGDTVLDLGAAPGGWSQIALAAGAAKVVAVDLLPHSLKDTDSRLHWIQGDFTQSDISRQIHHLGPFSVVLCDAAPSYSGQASLDHLRLIILAEAASEVAQAVFDRAHAKRCTMVVKVSRGGQEIQFRDKLKKLFNSVEFVKPEASRQASTEIYLVARGLQSSLLKL